MTRILIVDDEPEFREFLGLCLQRAGHEVDIAANGDLGLARLAEKAYDLVMTDIFMPERDGLEIVREARRRAPLMPIIAMSGGSRLVDGDYLAMTLRLGASRVIEKPFEPRVITALINDLLKPGPVAEL